MSTIEKSATFDDLYRTEGKAELIGGLIVRQIPTGILPNEVAGNVFLSLRAYASSKKSGRAFSGSISYAIPELPSGRESFSPDASYYDGPLPANLMRFVEGPPTFAAEVRSENDYGPGAEDEILAKRIDYFAAGTQVVWDVDPVAETIRCYRADKPDQPVTFRRGMTAEAEPAVTGWRMATAEVFA